MLKEYGRMPFVSIRESLDTVKELDEKLEEKNHLLKESEKKLKDTNNLLKVREDENK